MKRILHVFLLFCIISSIKAQPLVENIEPSTQYNAFFKEAYQKYPNIPKGILEAVAYTQTHIRHIDPNKEQQSCTGMPLPYGVMGLFDEGKGVFRENLKTIASLGHYDVQMIKSDARTNILAYAAAYSALLSARRITAYTPQEQLNILAELSELPLEKNGIDNFALDAQLYTILRFIQDKNNQSRFGFPDYKMDLRKTFGTNYEVLSATSVTLSEESIIAEDYFYHPEGSITSKVLSTDYAPALWNPTTCNYSSRNGTAITAYTVHTVQGTYSGCISWFKNCSAQASSHYVVRSSDGQVTQMVLESDKAWHVGSENPYTIGTEHEGFVDDASWYTLAMYASSADIVRDVINSGYGINGLRTYFGPGTTGLNTLGSCVKIKGHQHFPNQTHVDPGVNWNWEYFYTLVNNNPTITNYTTATGTVTDPGGANGNYANDIRQCILIAPNGASSVTLNVSIFDIETNWDYLLIFNGNNNQAPLLGKYTGKNIPTSILANSGKVYLEFRTDCATVDTGFVISWTSTFPDTTRPTTSIANLGWVKENFTASFYDNDVHSSINQRFYMVQEYINYTWRCNKNNGFFNDDFAKTTIHTDWEYQTGTWTSASNRLIQSDQTNGNTILSAFVDQNEDSAYLYHYKAIITGTGTNRRAGLHFMCSSPSLTNRGNSYFIYARLDNGGKLQVYKTINDVFSLKKDIPYTFLAGVDYDFKIIYNKINGRIDVYVNDVLITSWTDDIPITTGNYISFRSGECNFSIDFVSVYKNRNSMMPIYVGAATTNDIRTTNLNTTRPGGKILSLVTDANNLISLKKGVYINVDWTASGVPSIINDGTDSIIDMDSQSSTTSLSGNWSEAVDIQSGIKGYYYSIGTSPGMNNITTWTWVGTAKNFTKTGLNLTPNTVYFVNVKCKNNAGLISSVGSSDGILITPSAGKESFANNASDIDHLRLSPNPNKGLFTLSLNLNQAHDIKMDIYDISGKVVYSNIQQGFYEQGTHEFDIDVRPLNLETGNYILIIQTEKQAMSALFNIVH
ncbi:MAG: N-acetylmuramoyl-L-alanine amidase [Chitinophagales bacterium]|nr:N-acetylmuramoyl-L-alanine amidase [Chitinophagales bacterium]